MWDSDVFDTSQEFKKLNAKYAVVANLSGKVKVISGNINPETGFRELAINDFKDIRYRHNHIKVVVGSDKDGRRVRQPLGDFWIQNPKRRQFDYICFDSKNKDDSLYNMWDGFAFQPKDGDWSLFRNHLFFNICSGSNTDYNYLIQWMARTVQEPTCNGEVAIILNGAKGSGKSSVANHYGKLFGSHSLTISNSQYFPVPFNLKLCNTVFLSLNEIILNGDKSLASAMKVIMNEDYLPLKEKGCELLQRQNCIHLMMTSNEDVVVKNLPRKGKYFMLDVANPQEPKQDYFQNINKQLASGGYGALLFDLLNMDLTNFQVNNIPNQ